MKLGGAAGDPEEQPMASIYIWGEAFSSVGLGRYLELESHGNVCGSGLLGSLG